MPLTKINGVDINYLDIGEGEVVVLLHGLGSSSKDWDLQIPVLSPKFRVIAPDFRAHGLSTKVPEEQGVAIMKEDIRVLLNQLEIPKAHFVGFSMGGAVSFQLALDYPEMVDRLVIINSGPDFNNPQATGRDLLAERTKLIKEQGFDFLADKIAEGMYPEEEQIEWRIDFKNRILANDEDAYLHTFAELMKWGLGEKIASLPHRTLIVASDQDYTSIEYKKSYAEKMQNASLVEIAKSRHGVVVDAAEQLNAELLKFLAHE